MSDDDLLTALVSGKPQSADSVAAIVKQLRGRQSLGQLAAMSGDPALAPFGAKVLSEDQNSADTLGRDAIQNRSEDIRTSQFERQLSQGQGQLAEEVRWHNLQDQERKDKLAQQKALDDFVGNSQDTIDAIGQGRIKPPSMSRSPKTIALMDAVTQQYPNYDATVYDRRQKAQKDFSTGKQGDMVRSAGVSIQHLDNADQKADLLHNTNFPVWNAIKNTAGPLLGNQAITKGVAGLDTAKTIVSDEIDRFFINGGGAEKDRQHLQDQLSMVSSPDKLHEVTNTLRTLMAGQLNGLKGQYEENVGGDFLKEKLKNDPRILDSLGWDGNSFTGIRAAPKGPQGGAPAAPGPGSGPPQGAAPTGSTALPGAIGKLQGGMVTTSPDGQPITPYNAGGLVTAMRPDRPAPATPATEVPGVTIVKKAVNSKGELWALLSDGTEKKLDRQTYR